MNLSDALFHYGVKGMRWGVRKKYIPNPRKRGLVKSVQRPEKPKSAMKKARKLDPRTMTDDELKAHINRMNMEKQYNDLSSGYRGQVGKKIVETILIGSAVSVASGRVQKGMNSAIDKGSDFVIDALANAAMRRTARRAGARF